MMFKIMRMVPPVKMRQGEPNRPGVRASFAISALSASKANCESCFSRSSAACVLRICAMSVSCFALRASRSCARRSASFLCTSDVSRKIESCLFCRVVPDSARWSWFLRSWIFTSRFRFSPLYLPAEVACQSPSSTLILIMTGV